MKVQFAVAGAARLRAPHVDDAPVKGRDDGVQ